MQSIGALLVGAASSAALAVLLLTPGAEARAEASPGYTKHQTYSGALRYLRVDLGYEVVEKDPEAAYLIFRYAPPGRRDTTNGSIQIVETRNQVKILVQLPQMPQYHETVLRDGLVRKLRREYGDPPRTRPGEAEDKGGKAKKKEKKQGADASPSDGDAR
jgi:hypothetical protein